MPGVHIPGFPMPFFAAYPLHVAMASPCPASPIPFFAACHPAVIAKSCALRKIEAISDYGNPLISAIPDFHMTPPCSKAFLCPASLGPALRRQFSDPVGRASLCPPSPHGPLNGYHSYAGSKPINLVGKALPCPASLCPVSIRPSSRHGLSS
jgi:hypothetical protein